MFDEGSRDFENLSASLLSHTTDSDANWTELHQSGWWELGSDPAATGPFQGHELPTPNGMSASQWDSQFAASGGAPHAVFDLGNGGRAIVARSEDGNSVAVTFGGTTGEPPRYADFQAFISSLNQYIVDNHITNVIVTGRDLGGAVAASFMADHPDGDAVHYSGLIGGAAATSASNDPRIAALESDRHFEATDSHALVPIETAGNTTLNNWDGVGYQLEAHSSSAAGLLTVNQAFARVQDYLPWAAVGAEQVGNTFEIVWHFGNTDQYTVWITDMSINYQSNIGVVSGTSAAILSREVTFQQDFNGDGIIGVPTIVLETAGSTDLVQVGAAYTLAPAGLTTGPVLKVGGAEVHPGQSGAWNPIGAEQVAGGGYEVAWKATGTNLFLIWNVDANGNLISGSSALSGDSTTLQTHENILQQDLNGDGTVGVVATTKETAGSTDLVQVGNTFFFYPEGGSSGPQLKYLGAAIEANHNGPWNPIGVEASGNGYFVAWKAANTDLYQIWSTDAAGNFISNAIGVVSGSNYSLQAYEVALQQDLNGDGTTGVAATTIESTGATDLVQAGNAYFLRDHGLSTGPMLKIGGAQVQAGQNGPWSPVAVEQVGNGYLVAWKAAGTDLFQIWNVDANGNFISAGAGVVSGSSDTLRLAENIFHQDLNGDGTTGLPTTAIENAGGVDLVQIGSAYFLYDHGTSTGPQLTINGAAIAAGQNGPWNPVGVERLAGDHYKVAWKAGSQFQVWDVDSHGAFASSPTGVVSGNSFELEATESDLQQDLNGDGTTGVITTVIETTGTVGLKQAANHYFLTLGDGSTPQLHVNGVAVVEGQFGSGWAPIAAAAVGNGYQVAWKLAGQDQYTVLTADNSGGFLGHRFFVVSGSTYALQSSETTFQQDLNSDGTIGAVTVGVESSGSTDLARAADSYFLYSHGTSTGPQLKYQGAQVGVGQFGPWNPIAVEQVAGGGYQVAWKATGLDLYQVWNVDSAGNFLSSNLSPVSGSTAAVQAAETIFQQDLNGDGTVGLATTTIEAVGTARLVQIGGNYYLYAASGSPGPQLKIGGAAVEAGHNGPWNPIAVETVGSFYRVAWQAGTTFQVWTVDATGNYLATALNPTSSSSPAMQTWETTFQQDLNGDGQIGVFQTTIENNGSVRLAQVGNNYRMFSAADPDGTVLMYNGQAVIAGANGSWNPIGVEAVNQGYEMVWRAGNTDQYQVWHLSPSGSFASNYSGVVSGSSWIIKSLENSLQQNLNGDGVTGTPTSAYNISINYTGDLGYWIYFQAAATRWEQVITGDLPDVINAQYGYIDDLMINATVAPIDGVGHVLGSAGPDYIRSSSGLPTHGNMKFDTADITSMTQNGTFFSVVLHEMGHVLGLGSMWSYFGLSDDSGHYFGANALAAYRAMSGNPSATYVPLETGGGAGTAGSHWSEAIFGNELMTGYISGVPDPLSSLTIAALKDLGYTVNMAQAEAYTMPGHIMANEEEAA